MAVKIFIGLQSAEGVKSTNLIDMGATDFNLSRNISKIQSEVFQSVSAKGDSFVSKVEMGGGIPIEPSAKVLALLLAGLSYTKNTTIYKMSNAKPAYYTIVLNDEENSEKTEYVDCCIDSLGLKIEMGAYIKADVGVIGKDSTTTAGLVAESAQTERGASLLALHSTITLDTIDKTTAVEGVDITINNGLEAKGSINSQFTQKIKRSAPQETTVNVSMNEFEKTFFKSMDTKMLANSTVTGKVTLGDGAGNDIVIDIPKMFISDNKRGDYKGSGSHDIALECSANNVDKTHLKFTMPASAGLFSIEVEGQTGDGQTP